MTPTTKLNPPLPIVAGYRKPPGAPQMLESPVISSFKRKFSDLHVGVLANPSSSSRPLTPIGQSTVPAEPAEAADAHFLFAQDPDSYFPVTKKAFPKAGHTDGTSTPTRGLALTPACEEAPSVPFLRRTNSCVSVSSLIGDFSFTDRNHSIVDFTVQFSAKLDAVLLQDYEQTINNPQTAPFHGRIPPSGIVSMVTKRVLCKILPSQLDEALSGFQGYFIDTSLDLVSEVFDNKPLLLALVRKRLIDSCNGLSASRTTVQIPGMPSGRFSGLSDPMHSLSLSRNSSFSGSNALGRQHSNSSWLHVGNFGKLQATHHNGASSDSLGVPTPIGRQRNDSLTSMGSMGGFFKEPVFSGLQFFTPPTSAKSLVDITAMADDISLSEVEELEFFSVPPLFSGRPVPTEVPVINPPFKLGPSPFNLSRVLTAEKPLPDSFAPIQSQPLPSMSPKALSTPVMEEKVLPANPRPILRKKSLPRLLMDKLGYLKPEEEKKILFDGEITGQRKRDSLKLKRGVKH